MLLVLGHVCISNCLVVAACSIVETVPSKFIMMLHNVLDSDEML